MHVTGFCKARSVPCALRAQVEQELGEAWFDTPAELLIGRQLRTEISSRPVQA